MIIHFCFLFVSEPGFFVCLNYILSHTLLIIVYVAASPSSTKWTRICLTETNRKWLFFSVFFSSPNLYFLFVSWCKMHKKSNVNVSESLDSIQLIEKPWKEWTLDFLFVSNGQRQTENDFFWRSKIFFQYSFPAWQLSLAENEKKVHFDSWDLLRLKICLNLSQVNKD